MEEMESKQSQEQSETALISTISEIIAHPADRNTQDKLEAGADAIVMVYINQLTNNPKLDLETNSFCGREKYQISNKYNKLYFEIGDGHYQAILDENQLREKQECYQTYSDVSSLLSNCAPENYPVVISGIVRDIDEKAANGLRTSPRSGISNRRFQEEVSIQNIINPAEFTKNNQKMLDDELKGLITDEIKKEAARIETEISLGTENSELSKLNSDTKDIKFHSARQAETIVLFETQLAIDYAILIYPSKVLRKLKPHIRTELASEFSEKLMSGFNKLGEQVERADWFQRNIPYMSDILNLLDQTNLNGAEDLIGIRDRLYSHT